MARTARGKTAPRKRRLAYAGAAAGACVAAGLIAWAAWPTSPQEQGGIVAPSARPNAQAASAPPAPTSSAGAIPPGHAVTVFRPSAEPRVDTSLAGVVVCNLGRGGDRTASVPAMLDAADAAMRRPPTTVAWIASTTSLTDIFEAKETSLLRLPSGVMWILQSGSLDGFTGDPEKLQGVLRRFYRAMSRRPIADPRQHVVIVADDAWPNARAVITLLGELDVAVHRVGLEQTALVEVKRPDGSFVVGVPGPAYERLRGDFPRILDFNREKDKAEALGGDAGKSKLRAIEGQERAYIAEVLKRGGGPEAPSASIENRRLRALIREIAQTQGFDLKRSLYAALLEETTILYLSSMSGSAGVPGDKDADIAVRSLEHPSLGRVVAAFTDEDAWTRAKIGGDRPVPISGRKLFAYAMATKQGVLINHAGPDLLGIVGPTLEALARGDLPRP